MHSSDSKSVSDLSDFARPHLAVDLVLMTIDDGKLSVLMLERTAPPFAGQLVLPGGFVHPDETVEATARRILAEKAHLTDVPVEQFHAFSAPDRDPRAWVVSIAHLALVPYQLLYDAAGGDDDLRLPQLGGAGAESILIHFGKPVTPGFDHGAMLAMALARLRQRLDWSMAAFALLPGQFTLHELQRVHEVIRGQPLNKPLFRKKMLGQTFADGRRLQSTGIWTEGRRHRPAELYQLARAVA